MLRLLSETNTKDVISLTSLFGWEEVFPDYYGRLHKIPFKRLFKLYCSLLLNQMKPKISKSQAQEKIESFFKNSEFSQKEMKKIKRLAMKFKIKFLPFKKNFCKKCLSSLKGRIRVTKTHKTIECKICKYKNKFKIS